MQNYKLVKLEDFNIIVSNEQPKPNDVVYINNHTYTHEIRIYTTAYGTDNLKDCIKVIASDNPGHNLPSINYNGLEEKFGIVDVEKSADEYKNKKGSIPTTKLEDEIFRLGFEDGFKKAQSLNDKKFSLEDIKEALVTLSAESYSTNGKLVNKEPHEAAIWVENYIQSLQQPKVFDIEVKMEDVGREEWIGDDITGEPFWNEMLIPKVTNNQIKITKIL